MGTQQSIDIVYDDQCPICRNYCTRLAAKEDGPALNLIDARKGGALMDRITAQGLDIDEGMVVKIGDSLHYGSDAIHELSKFVSGKGVIGATSRIFFGSRFLAQIIYPPCKTMRNLVLRMWRIKKIENLKQRN